MISGCFLRAKVIGVMHMVDQGEVRQPGAPQGNRLFGAPAAALPSRTRSGNLTNLSASLAPAKGGR